MRVTVPTERLIGKSPEYVDAYAKTYKSRVRISRGLAFPVECAVRYGLIYYVVSTYFASGDDIY